MMRRKIAIRIKIRMGRRERRPRRPRRLSFTRSRSTLSTGADAVPEPGCGEAGEFLPFQPEKIVERSAQLPEAVVVSVEFRPLGLRAQKATLSGGEGGTNAVENRRSGPGSQSTPWEELTPRARSAIEARNRDTMAEITMRVESIRSDHRLRE